MFCSYCGAKIMDGSTYCAECGADLTKPHESVARPTPDPEPAPVSTPVGKTEPPAETPTSTPSGNLFMQNPAAAPPPETNNDNQAKKAKKPVTKKWWFWLIVIIVGLCVIGAIGGNGDSSNGSKGSAAGTESESTVSAESTSTPAPTPSPTPTLSPEEQKANFVASCQALTYEQVARDPDTYMGTAAHFRGKVSQVIEGDGFNVYMINVTADQYGLYTDAIYVQYTAPAGASRILEDDIVDIYGTMMGLQTYTTVLNAQKTIPAMMASYIDLAQ